MSERPIRIGVAGLGRAFTLMLPTLSADPRVQLVAACDPRPEARARFESDFKGRTYETVEALCADSAVEVVYVATPHQHHAGHACTAAAHGKHVLVEKPMAVTLAEATRMVEAAANARVHLVVGHSHSFDAPIARTRELIASGRYGRLRMVTASYFTDFLYRPRRPEELDTAQGGGVVFSQAAHQVDIVRLLAGGRTRTVRAATGNWDARRATEGAYSALLTFDDGAFASLTYSGYGHFDGDELMGWTSEIGRAKDPAQYGHARRALQQAAGADAEARAKAARNYGGDRYIASTEAPWHEHFGFVLASCERADLRPLPNGVVVYGDDAPEDNELARPRVPRAEVIDELYAAVIGNAPPLHDGRWGRASLEVCLGILQSAREAREIALEHQVGVETHARADGPAGAR
ncbi:MAG TPA: Gfo/Idh/MocA family oxidoreductase [Usitatibacter sp.]|jgi:phthalate 4,5-cis-dihydrodiol dehydrogenase|nr:Gfo/Idh/MocA family oxidoreductase [Usitatibacter sp.]